jgi:hypothetical protein
VKELNIEQERREFEADFKEQMGIDVGRTFHSCYASSRVEDRWNGWLAAKRAVVGSAEPVPMKDAPARIYLVIEDGGDAYSSFADAREQANMSDGIKWCEDRFSDRDVPYVRADFTAPPAAVSATVNGIDEVEWLKTGLRNYQEKLAAVVAEYEAYQKEHPAPASAEPAAYPIGNVSGPCVCGSWPGGECLKCERYPSDPPAYLSAEDMKAINDLLGTLEKHDGTIERCARHAKAIRSLLRHAASVSAEPVSPFAFVIVDKNGNPEFVTSTHDEAQAHINDAISEHHIHGAGKWRSIPAYEMRPSDDKLWDQALRERDYNAEIAGKLADAISQYFNEEIGEHSSANCPWLEALRVIEEAPPPADAKDSARLDWILEQAKLKTFPRGINHWSIDVALDAAGELDLGSVYLDGRAAIDAAIAAKEAGK